MYRYGIDHQVRSGVDYLTVQIYKYVIIHLQQRLKDIARILQKIKPDKSCRRSQLYFQYQSGKEMLEESRTLFERPVAIATSNHEEKETPMELAGVPKHLIEGVRAKERDKAVKQNVYIHQHVLY